MLNKIWPDKFLLNDKIAVVTGGAGIIGKAIVSGMSQANATIIIADIDKKKSKYIEKECRKEGLDVIWKNLDITNLSSINSLIKEIVDKYHKIDIWINAAYPRTKDWNDKFEDIKYSSWKKNVDMHMNGYFLCCQQIAKQMKIQRSGSIINFGSIYGIVGPDFSIYEEFNFTSPAAYSAIKGGIINFTRYLATYYGKYGVRVNAVCPGGIFDSQPQKFVKKYCTKTPLGRMGKPEDISGAIIFLSSDSSSYITGHVLVIDGGWTAW